jgi:hypothetical protein
MKGIKKKAGRPQLTVKTGCVQRGQGRRQEQDYTVQDL